MKIVFVFIALLITITGCNLQKHVTRNEVNSSSQTESKEQMASRLKKETQKDIRGSIDTHTSENCDTNFQAPGSSITGEKSLSDLINGGSLDLENEGIKGSVRIDSATGKVKLLLDEKPRTFQGKFNRTTDTHQTTNEQSNVKEDLKASGTKQQVSKAASNSSEVIKDVKRTVPWWAVPLGVVTALIIFFIANFIIRKYRS